MQEDMTAALPHPGGVSSHHYRKTYWVMYASKSLQYVSMVFALTALVFEKLIGKISVHAFSKLWPTVTPSST